MAQTLRSKSEEFGEVTSTLTSVKLRNKSMSQTSVNTIIPIDRDELVRLSEKGIANPGAVRTLKVKTVLESKFRHLNYIRNLAPHVIDEPPGLLGDDTAPNPSEAVLAALGSCLSVGIRACSLSTIMDMERAAITASALRRGRNNRPRLLSRRRNILESSTTATNIVSRCCSLSRW